MRAASADRPRPWTRSLRTGRKFRTHEHERSDRTGRHRGRRRAVPAKPQQPRRRAAAAKRPAAEEAAAEAPKPARRTKKDIDAPAPEAAGSPTEQHRQAGRPHEKDPQAGHSGRCRGSREGRAACRLRSRAAPRGARQGRGAAALGRPAEAGPSAPVRPRQGRSRAQQQQEQPPPECWRHQAEQRLVQQATANGQPTPTAATTAASAARTAGQSREVVPSVSRGGAGQAQGGRPAGEAAELSIDADRPQEGRARGGRVRRQREGRGLHRGRRRPGHPGRRLRLLAHAGLPAQRDGRYVGAFHHPPQRPAQGRLR